jgi:hypothetical protein
MSLLKLEIFDFKIFSDAKFVSANHILQFFCGKFSWLEINPNTTDVDLKLLYLSVRSIFV